MFYCVYILKKCIVGVINCVRVCELEKILLFLFYAMLNFITSINLKSISVLSSIHKEARQLEKAKIFNRRLLNFAS